MPFQLNCPGCQSQLHIANNANGKKIRCPRCKLIFVAKKPQGKRPASPPITPIDSATLNADTRVFISHAVADKEFVESKVDSFFKNQKIDTWYCAHDIPSGAVWRQHIMEGLNKSDWFVVVLSPQAVESKHVRKEVELAFETKRGRILPILMERCDARQLGQIHPELSLIQYEDFTKDIERSQAHLLISMIRQLNKERRDWEHKSERQTETIEDLRSENAQLNKQQRLLEDKWRLVASFDDHSPTGDDQVPPFRPLETRRVPIVAICNFKGGVGKTTLTANLGATLWSDPHRKRVLLIDLDYQGSLSGICLDRKRISKLWQQERLVQMLFKDDKLDPKLIVQMAHEVTDERTKNHEASIIAADEDLAVTETELLFRWMMRDSGVDARYYLRQLLHSDIVSKNYDIVLLDCPPRMTAAAINAFVASDYLLIPTPLEDVCIESVPRLLKWVQDRHNRQLSNLNVLGVVITRTRQKKLLEKEKELLIELKHNCQDVWEGELPVFETCIPTFPAVANNNRYPAQHASMRQVFAELLAEMTPLHSPAFAPANA